MENIALHSSILFSPILAEFLLTYSIPQLLYPYPQIPIRCEYQLTAGVTFALYSPGFEPPTSGSAFHFHYHLTMKVMDARALILVLIISSSQQAPFI